MSRLREVALWVGRGSKRIAVSVVGFSLIGVGVVMLVVPGPGLLAIAAGLAVLATQYAWARRVLEAARRRISDAGAKRQPAKPL